MQIICEKNDHVPTTTRKGNLIVNYFACDKFAKMSPKERFEILKEKNLCFQCLTPGLKAKHEGNCFDRFKCPNESHKRHRFGLHVLICDQHKNNKENLELLELYKAKCITGSDNAGTPYSDFSKNIGISFHVGIYKNLNDTKERGQSELAIYMLQPISIGTRNFNLFFDSGCGDMVCKKEAVDSLIKQKSKKYYQRSYTFKWLR